MTNEELIAQAREATRCFCVDTPEQECGEHGDSYARGMAALADALEAATRVPVQGKPNDDREAKAEALAEWQDGNSMRQYSEWYTSWEDGYDAGFSRAPMPNAATEELARIKPLFENLSREYPNECNKRVKAEAERDAAVAAVERVRAIHRVKHGEKPKYADGDYHAEREPVSWEKYSMCEGCSATWPCRTVAATYEAVVPGE